MRLLPSFSGYHFPATIFRMEAGSVKGTAWTLLSIRLIRPESTPVGPNSTKLEIPELTRYLTEFFH